MDEFEFVIIIDEPKGFYEQLLIFREGNLLTVADEFISHQIIHTGTGFKVMMSAVIVVLKPKP